MKPINFSFVALLPLMWISCAYANEFNLDALEFDHPVKMAVDLSKFTDSAYLPGKYNVDIMINHHYIETRNMVFHEDNHKLIPIITLGDLALWGVNIQKIKKYQNLPKNTEIGRIEQAIPYASLTSDLSRLVVEFDVPQLYINASYDNEIVDERYWDNGIPALLIDYNYIGQMDKYHYSDFADSTQSHYLNVNSRLSVGRWRFYSSFDWQVSSQNKGQYTFYNTYLQTTFPKMKTIARLGSLVSDGSVFSGTPFYGLKLDSDLNMLPLALRGYAPTINGVAYSHAKVSVTQQGHIVYQTFVNPGPFQFTGIVPNGYGGDYHVEVVESNGASHHFVVPYSTLPMMVREKHYQYSASVGVAKPMNRDIEYKPHFAQYNFSYGLPFNATVYGGALFSPDYYSEVLGMGYDIPHVGSFSLDATQANIHGLSDGSLQGQSYRFMYSKFIQQTNSTITLAGYRYSTRHYYDFNDAIDVIDRDRRHQYNVVYSLKNRFELNINQRLPDHLGSISLMGDLSHYWYAGINREVSFDYSKQLTDNILMDLSGNYQSNYAARHRADRQIMLTLSIPFADFSHSLNLSAVSDAQHTMSYSAMVSGDVDHGLSYTLAGNQSANDQSSIGLGMNYQGDDIAVNGNYVQQAHQRSLSYGVSGSVLLTQYGVTLNATEDLQSPIALIVAPDAQGTRLQQGSGIRLDHAGKGIVEGLQPYQKNTVSLDTSTLPKNVDIKKSSLVVIPTEGAVALVNYKTYRGIKALMTVKTKESYLPFATTVMVDHDPMNSGIVGENGLVYLSGIRETGTLSASWNDGISHHCEAPYHIQTNKEQSVVLLATVVCR